MIYIKLLITGSRRIKALAQCQVHSTCIDTPFLIG